MSTTPSASTTVLRVTPADIRNLMRGEGGVDLRLIQEGGRTTGMRVVGVTPGSTAARLGARNDDTIETLNDIPMTDIAGGYRAADLAIQSGKITIRGKRAGVPYTTILTIDPS